MPPFSPRATVRLSSGRVAASAGPGGFSARQGQIGGRAQTALVIDHSFFEGLENFIRQCHRTQREMPIAMDRLVRFMAYAHLGFAQKRALGPVDPLQRRPELAWKVPVRRITGRYFFGWKVKRRSLGAYWLYNDSREGFYIEYGIHRNPRTGQPSKRRIRRPVMKLSFMENLRFIEKSAVMHRVWASLYMPPPGQRRGKGFIWQMQSPATMAASSLESNTLHRLAP